MGLTDAAAGGDYRETLVALRDELAAAIEGTDSARDMAALSARLLDVLKELNEQPGEVETSPADEIAARHAARQN